MFKKGLALIMIAALVSLAGCVVHPAHFGPGHRGPGYHGGPGHYSPGPGYGRGHRGGHGWRHR